MRILTMMVVVIGLLTTGAGGWAGEVLDGRVVLRLSEVCVASAAPGEGHYPSVVRTMGASYLWDDSVRVIVRTPEGHDALTRIETHGTREVLMAVDGDHTELLGILRPPSATPPKWWEIWGGFSFRRVSYRRDAILKPTDDESTWILTWER